MVSTLASAPVLSYELTENISIGGVLSGAYQCQLLTEDADASNECRGAMPFQPEVAIRLTEIDEVFFKLGWAVGNGLNTVSPFTLAPWGADLEDDVKNINGSNRDYLLTAWYRHNFIFSEDKRLGATFGIIDARDYFADNGYADDEYTQFMNEVFVNSANTFVFSYDPGAVLEFAIGPWSLRGAYMAVTENDDGNSFDWGALQLSYTAETYLGEGYYAVMFNTTSDDFPNPHRTSLEAEQIFLLNAGQQLGDVFAAWLRIGWANGDAGVTYDALYSGGLNIIGSPWGRADDNIGIGYAYLDGTNLNLNDTHAVETYYRAVLNDYFALTADLQWMADNVESGPSPQGYIFGLRATTEF